MVYLDSSALVKLIVRERETDSLVGYLRSHSARVTCALARTEVPRAVRRQGSIAIRRAGALLRRVDLIGIDDALLDAAGILDDDNLRSLDAIHLAAARALGGELVAVVTYDQRMSAAARRLGLAAVAPG